MGFDWYKDDDTTLAGTDYVLTTTAGTPSAEIELHAWLNKGSSVGSSETRYLRLYVEDSGVYKTSGLDVLDRREIECRIIGSQNPDGVVGFSAPTTAWKPIGTRRSFQLPAIYPNCCIELEFRHNPTNEGGQSTPVTFRVKAVQGTGDVPMSIPDDVSVDGDLDFGGHGLSNVNLGENVTFTSPWNAGNQDVENLRIGSGASLNADLDTTGKKLTNMYTPTIAETYVATPVLFVLGRPAKTHVRLCATSPVTWPNRITNGDLASELTPWSGANWAQAAGAALHTAGATDPLVQSIAIAEGVRYRVTVTVSGAAGTVTPAVGAVSGTPIAAGAGTVTQEIVAGAGGMLDVGFAPTSDFDGALDDVLVEATFYGLPDPIDSETVNAEDRLLLAGEADATRDGKWIAKDAAPWVRHPDCQYAYLLYAGCFLYVRSGAANGRAVWMQTADIADLSTDPQTWEKAIVLP